MLIGGGPTNTGKLVGLTIANKELTEFHRLDYATAHSDVDLDTQGNEVIVMQNVQTDYIDLIPIDLNTKPVSNPDDYPNSNRTPLIRLYYNSQSPSGLNSGVHISCNVLGYCVVSTTTQPNVPEQNWLDRTITLVKLDRSHPQVFYLAKVYNTTGTYWEETHATITKDGKKVVWVENWGQYAQTGQTPKNFLMQLDMPSDWMNPGCASSTSAQSESFGASGDSGTVNVTAPGGCAWTATSNAMWITITSGMNGSGNGSVNYSVSSNRGSDRTGTLTIAGKTFTVSQTGVPQPETVSAPSRPDGPTSGSPGTSYTYITGGSTSSKGHSIQYLLDWGDGTNSDWLPVDVVTASKIWALSNSFDVKAKARCSLDTSIESSWSDPFTVVISNDGPDLTGSWSVPLQQSCRGAGAVQKCSIKGTFIVSNIGNEDASTTYATFYLSNNSTYEAGEIQLKSLSTRKIKARKSKAIRFSYNFPKGQSATNKYVIVVIDPDNFVAEMDETNNVVVFGPIR